MKGGRKKGFKEGMKGGRNEGRKEGKKYGVLSAGGEVVNVGQEKLHQKLRETQIRPKRIAKLQPAGIT